MAPANDTLCLSILESMSEAVCAFDRKHRITYWNRGAERITGYAAAEVIGRTCRDGILVHIDQEGRAMCGTGCLLHRVMSNRKPEEASVYLLHKEGHRVPVRMTSSALLDAAGRVVGGLQVFAPNALSNAATERIRHLERLSYLDPLTGLANRRYTTMILHQRCEELERYGWPFGVLLLDIDNLKEINDVHGHDAGDVVLRTVAKTLLLGSRPFDVKGRWGGDEFIAIVSNVDATGLAQAAQRFRSLIEASSAPYGNAVLRTTVSVGAALARAGENERALVRRADSELYESKSRGKNRVSVSFKAVSAPESVR